MPDSTPSEITERDLEPSPSGSTLVEPDRSSIRAMASFPEVVGRYRISRLLGQGGFGRVFLAFDEELRRLVALKLPHGGLVSSRADAEPYLKEAQAVASLDHPNIVPVFDVGSTDLHPCFIVSKYIEGHTLSERLRGERFGMAETADLISTLALALDHAHRQRLVHRDVKPGNILVEMTGKPHLVDFGLALRDHDVGNGPRFAGTPPYMSPEQAWGEGHRVDRRSDVYSLGAVLYEMLVGIPPFHGGSRDELMVQIRTKEIQPPHQIDDDVPRELSRICMKALAKLSVDRYQSAAEMAEDLKSYLGDRSEPRSLPRNLEARIPEPVTLPWSWNPGQSSLPGQFNVMPRGLRAFNEDDADFFLELLPGPRDRFGLPESLRFWKRWAEESDPRKAQPVGLIYGPSGSGKSSIVKAGLLPRLSERVVPIYLEATLEETEAQLMAGLESLGGEPRLPVNDLPGRVAAVRRGEALAPGEKLLIVLDQFEQWLHAHKEMESQPLVQALRQCDGIRVQCIVMVRDDFWMAATRFMKALEIRLVQGRNAMAVDLFDVPHAVKVLAIFGRAFGKLSQDASRQTEPQKAFLTEAVAGLADDGKVVCVRLALFAEMMRSKEWTREGLREMGGAKGVGLNFLETALGERSSLPEHRFHARAARAVLEALLPESDTNLKGRMRPASELKDVCHYTNRPDDFEDLIRILDSELRLISPAMDEVAGDADSSDPNAPRERSYQLTHDYLVHALRDWLSRKQLETRRGRATFLLNERAQLWSLRQERRLLPSFLEWLYVRIFTSRTQWTGRQHEMMKRAGRRHGRAVLMALVILMLTVWGMVEAEGHLKAAGLVASLKTANTSEVPSIIEQLGGSMRWARPRLEQLLKSDSRSREHLNASMALLDHDPLQLDYLCSRLQSARSDLPTLVKVLRPHRAEVVRRVWPLLEAARPGDPLVLSMAGAMASYAPDDPRWDGQAEKVARALIDSDPIELGIWTEALEPIHEKLTEPLARLFRDPDYSEAQHLMATNLLVKYGAGHPTLLTEILLDSDANAFATFLPKLPREPAVLDVLRRELAKTAKTEAPDVHESTGGPGLVERQGRAAVALVRMKEIRDLETLFRHGADPCLRGTVIHQMHSLGVDLHDLATWLAGSSVEEANDDPAVILTMSQVLFDEAVSTRRAIILAMGYYPPEDLDREFREVTVNRLMSLYRQDPDSGVHSAVEWTMRRWGYAAAIHSTDEELKQLRDLSRRRWFVNRQGETFAVIQGPVEFRMGSPLSERYRVEAEIPHQRVIPRRFAVCTKEVSVRLFEKFLEQNPGIQSYNRSNYSPDPDGPASGPSWYDAAAFCNWLSLLENREPCYEPNEHGEYAKGMKIRRDALTRNGYRMPTEAEWEYACRAGDSTCRYLGTDSRSLKWIAWYNMSSEGHAWPRGQLLPNDLGLFDMLGNVYEWCQSRRKPYPSSGGNSEIDRSEGPEIVLDDEDRMILRGGGFVDIPAEVRSAYRAWNGPYNQLGVYGFRIACTMP